MYGGNDFEYVLSGHRVHFIFVSTLLSRRFDAFSALFLI